MKIHVLALLIAVPAALSSCMSSDGRGSDYNGTTFNHNGGHAPAAEPQRTGWLTSPAIREAERKSISHDIPYGVVKPDGPVVDQ